VVPRERLEKIAAEYKRVAGLAPGEPPRRTG
jgi:hypothetical protein